jgi:type IV secretion system protein VirB5
VPLGGPECLQQSPDAAYNQALKDATGSAATTAALGTNTLAISQTRMQGLRPTPHPARQRKDPKDVMDLQARIGVEQAQLQNDQLKLQAIQMAQAGRTSSQSRPLKPAPREMPATSTTPTL